MTQIAVKLPDELVAEVDELVADGAFANRSVAVRRGLEAIVDSERRRRLDGAYEDGYRRIPETEQELAEATRLAIQAIHDEPWDPWW
ncbi:MAG: ribbon-helix-helix domain-containing protein [Actinomycetota bacterium]|jgi:Arc/MetJ-type ribon-helix-helix transcriptional regulator|nr:ribbon-helix-helix domain-containing protein [Actinomycetota bacterium]